MSTPNRLEKYYREKWEAEQAAQHPEPPPPSKEWLHTFGPAVLIPGAQSMVTGVFIGIAAWTVAGLAEWPQAWRYGLGAWATFQAITWTGLLWRWMDLTALERVVQVDLNRDGYIGEPAPELPSNVRIEISKPEEQQTVIAHIPADANQVAALASGLLVEGKPFSEREWTGTGKPFSVNQFRELRAEMLKRGLLGLINPKDARQGYALTVEGQTALGAYTSPTLPAGSVRDE